ncbi:SusC/RagA family TonB-linked outer membrane protein [Sphingobacterium sp. DK4209]|uniref:SusC/RagA family TonB-linked outer membrane protein n=2 Tax=Sphingobacterium zhuxiongii TaxID=2662364 RepID=A0A5Q0QBA6_9SPHI|nr:SusC/RagA family TonB-linked outer membrane protein [Sphingobacterium sp. DK4209]QGA24968.1 SusC/RagA family TonB-linked outer membrane protein [Sphingobacterium sp. dk4302]
MNNFSFGKRSRYPYGPPFGIIIRIMKITTFLLLIFMSCAYADGTAQHVSLRLKGAKIEDAFQQISKQTKFKFLYSDDVVRHASSINLNVKNAPLKEVLSMLLDDNSYSFKIIANTISVNYKAGAANLASAEIIQHQVSGTVKGSDGKNLANASVQVKGSSAGTATGESGNFSFAAPADATLVVRYVGYKTKEVAVAGRSVVHIVLEPTEQALDAVNVVATGYQTLDRKLFTGATSKIDAKDAERAGVPDISRMLEGQAAGVSVQNVSGTFGAAPKIRVRGATSITGDNKPLWVIDGVILDEAVNISNEALSTGDANTLLGSSVAGLNPDDIESITILKDAAATAMYGAAAMNGVVVVNTKKGRNTDGAVNINYTGNFTTYIKPSYRQFDIMNSGEQMDLILDLERKGFLNHSGVSRSATGGVFWKMYNQMYIYDEKTDTYALRNDAPSRYEFLQRYGNANTDWFDLLFKNSLVHEHSLSVSSGTAKSQTYASTSYMDDSGFTQGNRAKRFTANLRNNFTINDKLKAEILFQGNIRDQKAPGTINRASDAVYGNYSRDFDINPYSYALNTSRIITPYHEDGSLEYFIRDYGDFNILNELDNNYINLKLMDLKVQGGITYKIIPELTYSVTGMYRYYNSERQHYITENSNIAKSYRANGDNTINGSNRFLYKDPDYPNRDRYVILPNGGFFNTSNNNMISYYLRHNLEYDKKFNDHSVNFFGTMELQYADKQNHDFTGPGIEYGNGNLVMPTYRFYKKGIEGGDTPFSMWYSYDRKIAYAVRGAYNYKDKYSFNFTTRYDGSNKMGSSKVARWLPTWNVSGAWDIDQEEFFNKESSVFSSARIRGTYGLVANMGNASNSAAVYYNAVAYRPYESEREGKIDLSGLENKDLTWEKMYEVNIGTDLGFFNNKVDAHIDYYRRNIFDLIGSVRTSGIGGQYTKAANYADMTGEGVDFEIGGFPFRNPDGLTWRTQFSFGYNRTKITNMDVSRNIWNLVSAEGGARLNYAHRGLYSLDFDKLYDERGYPTFIGPDGTPGATYFWLQSDEIEFLKYEGPVDPVYTGGFFNRFEYKNFSMSFLLKFGFGNMVRLQPAYSAVYSDMYNVSKDLINRWIYKGDEILTVIPSSLDTYGYEYEVKDREGIRTSGVYTYNAFNYSSERVAKGDYIRLSQVTLGYSLPSKYASAIKFRSAQFNLVGNNLFLLYSDKKLNGVDPEFYSNGGVALPVPRQVTFSLKLGF